MTNDRTRGRGGGNATGGSSCGDSSDLDNTAGETEGALAVTRSGGVGSDSA